MNITPAKKLKNIQYFQAFKILHFGFLTPYSILLKQCFILLK